MHLELFLFLTSGNLKRHKNRILEACLRFFSEWPGKALSCNKGNAQRPIYVVLQIHTRDIFF